MDGTSLPVKAEDWTDSRSMSSEDGYSGDMIMDRSPSPPGWMNQSTSDLQNGQLSPVSPTGMDLGSLDTSAGPSSSAPRMIHSASSSCTDSWSITGYNPDDRDDADHDVTWEQGSDDVLKAPKLEPQEDEYGGLAEMKDVLADGSAMGGRSGQPGSDVAGKAKRPRGRPRKHPVAPSVSANKVTKGRSKTGCITCRKRKKKCDEAKPRCMNCDKNAVVCEGYHEKQIWKSGRERAEEERMRREDLPVITMQPLFHGVETVVDKIFWKHYCTHLSNVLTVEGEAKNAFKDIVLQLATRHQGLMHSILALSSKHIDYDTPYGAKLLQDNASVGVTMETLTQRSNYHHEEAMKRFYEDIQKPEDNDDPEYKTVLSARYGQMLCLLLQTLAEGNPRGEHRVHLQAYKNLIQHQPPEEPVFLTFITEFFQYHIYADELIWHPVSGHKRLASEDWVPPIVLSPPRLLGVADGLFRHLSQITTIRHTIRENMKANIDPVVDYRSLYRAGEIEAAIQCWEPQWPPGDSRNRVYLLYKQMMWVYLFRTIFPPSHTAHVQLPPRPTPLTQSVTALPRGHVSAPTSPVKLTHAAAAPGSPTTPGTTTAPTSSRNPSRTGSLHEQRLPAQPQLGVVQQQQQQQQPQEMARPPSPPSRASSPPPIRRPAQHDPRITVAVNESLVIMESFKPSDPAQTILLIPCLVVGASCFEPQQQERIRAGVRCVRGYTGLRNCDCVLGVLEEVWRLMALGEWVRVWDWQGVAQDMGLDFLCT